MLSTKAVAVKKIMATGPKNELNSFKAAVLNSFTWEKVNSMGLISENAHVGLGHVCVKKKLC